MKRVNNRIIERIWHYTVLIYRMGREGGLSPFWSAASQAAHVLYVTRRKAEHTDNKGVPFPIRYIRIDQFATAIRSDRYCESSGYWNRWSMREERQIHRSGLVLRARGSCLLFNIRRVASFRRHSCWNEQHTEVEARRQRTSSENSRDETIGVGWLQLYDRLELQRSSNEAPASTKKLVWLVQRSGEERKGKGSNDQIRSDHWHWKNLSAQMTGWDRQWETEAIGKRDVSYPISAESRRKETGCAGGYIGMASVTFG